MRGTIRLILLGATMALTLAVPRAYGAPPAGATLLDAAELAEVSSGGKSYLCGNLPPWSPGRMVAGYFYPTSVEISALKKKVRAAKSGRKAAKLRATLAKRKATLKKGKSACAGRDSGDGDSGGGDDGGGGNYDSAGNVTTTGKIAFGIPTSLAANVNTGLGTWNRTCRGCHATLPMALGIKNFTAIKERIQLSPMLFRVPEEVTEQMIADVTAAANYR